MLCDSDIEGKGVLLLCNSKWLWSDNRVKFSALFSAGHRVSEVANLVGVSCTIGYPIKKLMDNGAGVNRRAAVVERLLWFVTACRMPFEGLLRLRNAIRGTASRMLFDRQ